MLNSKTLYDVYKEYAWREYELVDQRMRWAYLANVVLAVGLGVIVQEQLRLISEPSAIQRVMMDAYAASLFTASQLAIIIVPGAGVIVNIAIWLQLMAATFAGEGVRKRWRAIRSDPERDAEELPQLGYGFHDVGQGTKGVISTSLVPAMFILFWLTIGLFGIAQLWPGLYSADGWLK